MFRISRIGVQNQSKILLYFGLVATGGLQSSMWSQPSKQITRSCRPKGDDNVVVFYVNGKEITTLSDSAGSLHGRLSGSNGSGAAPLAGFDAHISGNRAEIHVHLPQGQLCHEAFMVQLAHGLRFMLDKLHCIQPAVVQAADNSAITGLFGANFLAENNVGIIHLHFDGLVGASGLSSATRSAQTCPNSVPPICNKIAAVNPSDDTSSLNSFFSANFVAKNNMGTVHIHLPADVGAGVNRLFRILMGLKGLIPGMLPASMRLCNKGWQVPNDNSAGGPWTVNLTAQNTNGVLHLDFDGLVGGSGFSGGCAPNSMIKMENPMCQMGRVSVGAGCPSGGVFAANFVAQNNIGTIHLY